MSNEIDEKVVELRFDNKQFEREVQTSLSTIEKLKSSLNLTGATKGLENVNAAAKGVDLNGLSTAVETVNVRFSALKVIAARALSNITDSAMRAGKKIISALTIDPIKSGFAEYETQINAVQTILANTESKGKTIKDVNAALDELNAYADRTIYNFTEMTRNIGTFTAAGVDLDTSVAAIKGIANLAAVSGSTSQQASTAMYQLSQALSSGTVKLMDWNSVVNAGMGGQVFQDALKDTARVHGIQIDAMIEKEGSFRETLKNGWLSAEILTETLSKFTGDLTEEQLKTMGYTDEQIKSIIKMGITANDAATKVKTFTQLFDTLKEAAQSGWTQSWEIIVGDFEEAKELLTEVSNAFGALIGASAEARNEVLQGWKDLGGRTLLIEGLRNALQGVKSIIVPIAEAFKSIFPPITAQQLLDLTKRFKDFTAGLIISEGTADKLKRTFKGVFALVDIGVKLISAIGKGIWSAVKFLSPLIDGVLWLTAVIGDLISGFRDFISTSDIFNKAIANISALFSKIVVIAKNMVVRVGQALLGFSGIDLSGIENFVSKVREEFKPFESVGDGFKKVFETIWKVLKAFAPIALKIGRLISDVFGNLFDVVYNALVQLDGKTLVELIESGLLSAALISIKQFFDTIRNTVGDFTGVGRQICDILGGVTEVLHGMAKELEGEALREVATAIGILAVSLFLLSIIDKAAIESALTAIAGLFAGLFISMGKLVKIAGKNGRGAIAQMVVIASMLKKVAMAVLILSASMVLLGTLDQGQIDRGLTSVAALLAMILVFINKVSKNTAKMTKGLGSLILVAVAIRILVGAVRDLGEIDTDGLTRGLIGVGVLLVELAAFMALTKKMKMGTGKGLGLVLLAAALNILATAVKKFGDLDPAALERGLTAMGIVLAELVVFTNLTKKAKRVVSTATGLVIIAASMLIFAKAIGDMGALSWDEIGRGLTTMAGALAIVIAALALMPKGAIKNGTGLVLIASSLLILSNALANMGAMDWDEIYKAGVALAGSLALIVGAMALMKHALAGSAALLVVTTSLLILSGVLKIFGNMSWLEIAKGLGTLAAAFVILGVAGLKLAPLVPTLLGVGGAIALIGLGCVLAGAGIVAISAGLTSLAAAGIASSASLVTLVATIIGLIPMIVVKIAEGLVDIIVVIGNSAGAIMTAVAQLLKAILDAIIQIIPPLLTTLGAILDALIPFLIKYTPKIIEVAVAMILALLDGVERKLPDILQSAVRLVITFCDGLNQEIPRLLQAAWDLIINLINGLANSIDENMPKLIDAVKNLFRAVIDAAKLVITSAIPGFASIGNAIMNSGFIKGVKNTISSAVSTVKSIPSKCADALKAGVSNFKTIGRNMIDGLVNGIKSKVTDAVNAVKNLGSKIVGGLKNLLGIHSPSKVFAEIGEYSDEGLAGGLKKFAGVASSAAEEVGEGTVDAIKTPLSRINDVLNDNISADPTIRPVIDLTDIQNGANSINGMFNNPQLALATSGLNVSSIDAHTGNLAKQMAGGMTFVNDNRDVVSALDKVREDIYSLGEAISRMRVVLDSGATVGELQTEFDKQMGAEITYKGRWL